MNAAVPASVALLAAGVVYARLLGLLRRFERKRPGQPPWWFGYARDGVNLVSAALLFGGCVLAAYPGPQALALALGGTLLVYAADAATSRSAAAPRWARRGAITATIVALALLGPACPWLSPRIAALFASLVPSPTG